MFSAIIGAIKEALAALNKFLPSWDWKGGEASQRAKHLEQKEANREKVDSTPYPGSDDVVDSLHDGDF